MRPGRETFQHFCAHRAELLGAHGHIGPRKESLLQGFASSLQRCGNARNLAGGRQVHATILRNGYGGKRLLENLLVEMYGKCGSIAEARAVFDATRNRNVYSWTIMIAAYAQNGQMQEAVNTFRQMDLQGIRPNEVTFVNFLTVCSSPRFLELGKAFHQRILAEGFQSQAVLNTLVSMYGKCRSLRDAQQVFRSLDSSLKSSVSCNAMIAAYAQQGQSRQALKTYAEMNLQGIRPDRVTYMLLVEVCSDLEAVETGRVVHSQYEDAGELYETVDSALIGMYGRCRSLDEARAVFDRMQSRDLMSWTTMVSAYARCGYGSEALQLYRQMDLEGVKPDVVTLSSLVDACGSVGEGRAVHERIRLLGWEQDLIVANCIMGMYERCGRLDEARQVFDGMLERDIFSWTMMMAAYARHGYAKEAAELYQNLDQEGFKPDEVTLTIILAACSHSGLLDDGWTYFVSMVHDHGISIRGTHFGCLVDLLGRAGKLDVAEELLGRMPVGSSSFELTAFLAACTFHGDTGRAACVSRRLTELDPSNPSSYVMISNMYQLKTGTSHQLVTVPKAALVSSSPYITVSPKVQTCQTKTS